MANTAPAEAFRHVRRNPSTGENDYFFPLEITDPSIRALAREQHLDVTRTRLGNRVFEAVMVPCRESVMRRGLETPADTPPETQRMLYLACIKDELSAQEVRKQDGRCLIPDGKGGLKRCPLRVPNPAYTPGSSLPKTLPVRCQDCRHEAYRQTHSRESFCEAVHTPQRDPFAADRYPKLRKAFLAHLKQHTPKLLPLAALLTLEYSTSEAARKLGLPVSTAASQVKKLRPILNRFLADNPC